MCHNTIHCYTSLKSNSELQLCYIVRHHWTLQGLHPLHSRFTCRTVLHQPTFQCFRSSKPGQNMAACALDLSSSWPREGFRQFSLLPHLHPFTPCASSSHWPMASPELLGIDCTSTSCAARVSYLNIDYQKQSERIKDGSLVFNTPY